MQLGDKYCFTPTAFEGEKSSRGPADRAPKPRMLTGRISYIHSQRRYFTVEAMVNGQVIRESFSIKGPR